MKKNNTGLIQFGVQLISITYLALGVIGFIPLDIINPFHPEGVGARYLLHQVAIDPMHNIIHLAIGLSGLWALRSIRAARIWGKVVGITLLGLFVVGMLQAWLEGFPQDQMLLLGIVPLNSAGHILHLTTGALALYLGLQPDPTRVGQNGDVPSD